jgi:dynein heavy chain
MLQLKAKQLADNRYQNVSYQILNPKSVSMGELYGFVDEMTQEWVDGIASQIIRQCNTTNIENP